LHGYDIACGEVGAWRFYLEASDDGTSISILIDLFYTVRTQLADTYRAGEGGGNGYTLDWLAPLDDS